MFDMDKYLDELNIKDIDPPVDLVERTMQNTKGGFRVMRKRFTSALSAAAVILIGVVIGVGAFGESTVDEPIITGYYTIDINPSICLGVDANDKVAKVISQNEDADLLLVDLDFKGDDIQAAIVELVNAAKAAGYLADEEKYVLVGYFSKDGFFASALQADLEKDLGNMVHLLLVSGTLENKEQADDLGVSAGLLALSKETEGVSITKSDGVKEVIAKCEAIENPVTEEPDDSGTPTDNGNSTTDPYIATTIKGSITGTVVNLSWNKIDQSKLDGYKVMYSFTDSTPVYGDGHDGCRYYIWITDANTTSVKIPNVTTLYGYEPGKTCYFSITALYEGHAVKKPGNAIGLLMPSTPAATLDAATISGSADSAQVFVNLSWTKVNSPGFKYYKVMASFTDPTPAYGESGCEVVAAITDPNITTKDVYINGLQGLVFGTGQTCYFSITAVYDAGNAAGNTQPIVLFKSAPINSVVPLDTATIISGSSDSSNVFVNLSWTKVNSPGFKAYKIVYSFTDTTPVFGESGCMTSEYYNPSGTGTTGQAYINGLQGLVFGTGQTCYFSITTVYDSGNVPGNAIPIVLFKYAPI